MPLPLDAAGLADVVAQSAGVLLTGGDDIDPRFYRPEVPATLLATCALAEPGRDAMELGLIAEVFRQRKPLLAICRGHQLVNVFLGGTLYVDLPTEFPSPVNHHQMAFPNEECHRVTLLADSQLAALTGVISLGVNTTHHQGIHRLAASLRAAATAPDGLIEATELKPEEARRRPWFQSVQFHPERLAAPEHARLFQAFVAACQRVQI